MLELSGVIPPLVTPFGADGEVDEPAMRREVRYLLAAGVHALTVTGSTGEGHTLSVAEACRVAEIALEEAAGRVPVVSGIIADSTRAVVERGLALKACGVAGLQVTPVHYLFTPDGPGTVAYYREIGAAVELPLVVYNVVPWNTIDVPVLLELAELPHVVAVKQSGGDIHKLADLLRAVRARGLGLRVLSAVDALLFPSYLLGAHGSVAAILTAVPHQSVALWNACAAGDLERARAIHEAVLPVWRCLEESTDMVARLKALLTLSGRDVGGPRAPLRPVGPAVVDQLKQVLAGSGELAAVAAA